MVILEVFLDHSTLPPAYLTVRGHGHDESVESYLRIIKPLVQPLNRLMEPNLQVVRTLQVANTVLA